MKRAIFDRLRQLLVLTALVGMLAFTVYSMELPLNGRTQQQIARDFDVFLIPADYAFAIWAVIYMGLIAYMTYQLLPRQTDNALHRQIAPWFMIGCVANCAWIYCWHFGLYQWALCAMLVLLESLMAIYVRLGIGRFRVRRNEILFVRIPFSLYFGWITVATIVTITTYLDHIDWHAYGLHPELWALIVLSVGALLGGLVAMRHRDFVYAGAIIWGFVGVAVKHSNNLPIVFTVAVMSAVMILAIFAVPSVERTVTLNGQ